MITARGYWRFVQWTAVGTLGLALKTLVIAAAHEWLGVHYLLATALSVEAAVLHNFCWHQCWTWRDRPAGRRAAAMRLLRFHASTGLLAIGGNLVLMRLLVGGLGLHYILANVICAPTLGALSFAVAELLIFVRPACHPVPEPRAAFFRT